MKRFGWLLVCLMVVALLSTPAAHAQHLWQKPLPPKSRADLEKIMGPVEQSRTSKDRHVVIVWVPRDHDKGFHEYELVMIQWRKLLSKVPGVTVDVALKYPTMEQWEKADLMVFYLHLDFLEEEHYVPMDAFLARGGGIVAIHESMIQRPTGDAWAERIGLAWDNGRSKWGLLPNPITIDNTHPIFQGFPKEINFVDEYYWVLTGDHEKINILGTAQAGPPDDTRRDHRPDQLDGKAWPVFWTREHDQGRAFCSLVGHNLFTFDNPEFRIILFRGMAWAMHESFDPFKPLVTDGVTLAD